MGDPREKYYRLEEEDSDSVCSAAAVKPKVLPEPNSLPPLQGFPATSENRVGSPTCVPTVGGQALTAVTGTRRTKHKRSIQHCARIQLALGIIIVSLRLMAGLSFAVRNIGFYSESLFLNLLLSCGVWGGVLSIVSGSYGVAAARNPKTCFRVTHMVLSVCVCLASVLILLENFVHLRNTMYFVPASYYQLSARPYPTFNNGNGSMFAGGRPPNFNVSTFPGGRPFNRSRATINGSMNDHQFDYRGVREPQTGVVAAYGFVMTTDGLSLILAFVNFIVSICSASLMCRSTPCCVKCCCGGEGFVEDSSGEVATVYIAAPTFAGRDGKEPDRTSSAPAEHEPKVMLPNSVG